MFGVFDGQALYADGMNLYVYAGGNPVNGSDALGLYYDPFEEVDDIISDIVGERVGNVAALADKIGFAFEMGSVIASTLFSITPMGAAVDFGMALASGDAASIGLAAVDALGGKFLKALNKGRKICGMLRGGARAGRAAGLAFKKFTRGNFRHNLKVLTEFDAPTNIHAHHMLPVEHANEFREAGISNIHDPKWGAWWGEGHLNRYYSPLQYS